MKWLKRSDMKPGTIFVLPATFSGWRRRDLALVVINAEFETDFWRGGLFVVGDVAPDLDFEVLCVSSSTQTASP